MPETPIPAASAAMTVLASIEADDTTIIRWLDEYAVETGYDDAALYDLGDVEPDDVSGVLAERHFHQFGGYEGWDVLSEVKDVRAVLSEKANCRLSLSPIHDGDGACDGFMVEAHVEDGIYLSTFVEWKHITDDRAAKGLAAALGYAHALIHEFNRLVEFAIQKGL